jgi:DHA1 family bicyclomycin/chloramphenicol resistance-like MFS transporter
MSDRQLIIYCGLLFSIGAFSIDITLPFFAAMTQTLQAPHASVQMTVTLYVFALGVGQLLFGPLSDRAGRRRAILIGLSVYLLGTLVALLSPSIEGVLAGRVLQGLGGAAGPVVGRAIIRDLFTGRYLAQNMAIATGIFSAGPIFAPLIGVGIAKIGGDWRSVFVGMALFGAGLMLALAKAPETLAQPRPDALRPRVLARNVKAIFAHPQSRWFLLVSAVAMSSMISIVSSAPRVYEREFGVTGALFAVLFALHGVGIILGQFANHRMIGQVGPVRTAIAANAMLIFASALIAGFAYAGWLSAYLLAFFVFLFATGYLIVMSNAISLTLDPHGATAGFTSSFHGFFSMGVAASLASLIAIIAAGDAFLWGAALSLLSLVSMAMLLAWRQT